MKKKNFRGVLIYVLMLVGLIVALTVLFDKTKNEDPPPTYSEILEMFRGSEVKEFVLDDRILTMQMNDGSEIVYEVPYLSLFIDDITEIMDEKRAANIDLPEPGAPIISTLCPPAAAISNPRLAASCPMISEKSITEVSASS